MPIKGFLFIVVDFNPGPVFKQNAMKNFAVLEVLKAYNKRILMQY